MLLPKLAEYFEITIDSLFYINEDENILSEDSANPPPGSPRRTRPPAPSRAQINPGNQLPDHP